MLNSFPPSPLRRAARPRALAHSLALLGLLALLLAWPAAGLRAQALPRTFVGGNSHSLSIHADGTLWATGNNQYGQLGTGTTSSSSSWVQVGTATNWVQVAVGLSHSLGLRADGTLWAWGLNAYGQLGTATNSGSNNPNPTPTQVPGTYTQVAANLLYSLGLRADGSLWAWGNNAYGQLGTATNSGSNNPNPTPTQVPGTYTQVAAGSSHGLGLRADGTLWAWGWNQYGQLGTATNAGTSTANPTPTQVAGTYTLVAAGISHSLGLRADGTLWAWGYNIYGQLGSATNNYSNNANPAPAQVGTATYTQVAAGSSHSLGLRADGTLWAWGYNIYGQLGSATNSGTSTANPTPTQVAGTYTQVAAGVSHSLGLRADGTLWAWGNNNTGQLGTATNSGTTTPNPAPAATGTALVTRSLAMGGDFGLAVRGDGTLWAWGSNQYGQLGQPGTTTRTTRPVQLGTATDWVMVAAGNSHSLALKADGTLWAWGSNDYAQLGTASNNGTANPNPTPMQVAGTYTRVAAGVYHSLALRADGTLYAWGFNQYGQLGNATGIGSFGGNPTPTQVAGTYVRVAAGYVHSLGLRADGSVWAWGSNRYGQLGSATNSGTNNANPTPMQAAGTYAQVAAGYFHSLGLGDDGTLYAWGYNQNGQLGNATNTGTFNANSTPTAVAGTYAQAVAGLAHSLGLRADGTLSTWGNNQYGQLGNGATGIATSPTPSQEATLGTGWTTLGVGSSASFSLVRTASALTFASTGLNNAGQLGDGTTTNATRFDRLSPLRSLQPLPVTLVSFSAVAESPTRYAPAAVRLTWVTTSEQNSRAFEVERSLDGAVFARLGTVAAAGSSTAPRHYGFTDNQVPKTPGPQDPIYYRLRQVDADGTASYSPVRMVTLAGAAKWLSLFPNPAHGGGATLTGAAPGTVVTVDDALGRPVTSTAADASGTATLALPAGLPAGVYVVRAGTRAVRLTVE